MATWLRIIEQAVTEKLERLEARRFGKTKAPRKEVLALDASKASRDIPRRSGERFMRVTEGDAATSTTRAAGAWSVTGWSTTIGIRLGWAVTAAWGTSA